ncbi:MAG: aromatic ring-hydroxylating dioxygenase subunit alpha [Myxococcota bacterium]|nr:aromatic ring-hydroxylating dioxygenase subunit alpha [Myxococcota bacterium]
MAIEPLAPARVGEGERSQGLSYQELLDTDTRTVPEVLRLQSARDLPVVRVPIERYVSREFHDLEVEKIWKKVWQFACREDELAEAGDHVVYDLADQSILIVRGDDGALRAFPNACLHRGRALKDRAGRSKALRCPFHGWTWSLDGRLQEVPCRWDFDHVDRDEHALKPLPVDTWGGFVFVNPDAAAAPLADHLGSLPRHFERWPLEKRYTEAHVARVMPCNWKVAQEAFMEAYHVVATHPQILHGIGDANSQYDAWDHFSRAITPNMTPSPHLKETPAEQEQLDAMMNRSLDAPPTVQVPEGMTARQILAQVSRMQLQGAVPSVTELSDAELADSFYYTVFPNFHPWGAYNRITYRFRPHGNDPHRSIMEVLYLAPYQGRKPEPAPVHWLDVDEPWTEAPELGSLAKVFSQDTFNMAPIQKGLRAARHTHVTLGRYQETKIRHFHCLLERYLEA